MCSQGKERWSVMIVRQRFFFDKEKKKEFLRGYRMDYIAEKSGISYSYLIQILRGVFKVDNELIDGLMQSIGYSEKEIKTLKTEYFKEV